MADPEQQLRALQNLVAAVDDNNDHIDTGILGAKYILNTLTDHGRTDVAYRMASQKDLPGWGWWIEQGATTLWEQWNGTESRNHIMFGDISAWFYKALAGINGDPASPGFKHFFIRPHPVGDLTYVRAEYNSIHGKIVSDWKLKRGKFILHVVIPANTTATICIPNTNVNEVFEGRKQAMKASGITTFSQTASAAVFEAGSGEYVFTCPAKSDETRE